MAPNFTLLSSGEKGFRLLCSFCKKLGRKHLHSDSQVSYKTEFFGLQQQKRDLGEEGFSCPFVVSDMFQSK